MVPVWFSLGSSHEFSTWVFGLTGVSSNMVARGWVSPAVGWLRWVKCAVVVGFCGGRQRTMEACCSWVFWAMRKLAV